jgi:subtilisin family serine protease
MICVAASDQNDNPWSSSNYGTTTVKLAAPGVNIYSTLRLNNYGYISGTSMASPQVAGTAALILSRGYASVGSLIATILNNVDPLPSLSSYVSTGGRLNVCKAVPGCTGALSGTPANSSPPAVTGVPQYGSLVSASRAFGRCADAISVSMVSGVLVMGRTAPRSGSHVAELRDTGAG